MAVLATMAYIIIFLDFFIWKSKSITCGHLNYSMRLLATTATLILTHFLDWVSVVAMGTATSVPCVAKS